MKILFLTVGPEIVASSRVRVYRHLPYLAQRGIRARVIALASFKQARRTIAQERRGLLDSISEKVSAGLRLAEFVFLCPRYDVVFIQKIILPRALVNIIKRLNSNIVFDFDDAVFLQESGRQAGRGFTHIVRHARCVIAGNAFLKQKAASLNSDICLLHSCVDLPSPHAGIRPVQKNGCLVIGWIGSPQSSQYLRMLETIFNDIIKKFEDVRFEFVGADGFYRGRQGFVVRDWALERQQQDLLSFDIGIMPLEDDDWCRGKGGYKLLQYMSRGLPCVASPVGINKEIIRDGINGFLASSQEQWLDRLSRLIEDAPLRRRMGEEGLSSVRGAYSQEAGSAKLAEILSGLKRRNT